MSEDIKNNIEIYPAPGDIILERSEFTDVELGRYIVLNREVQEPNAHYYYVEYYTFILYYGEAHLDSSMRPGQYVTLTSADFMGMVDKWEIVVESGLSWEQPPVEQNVVINR